MKNTFILKSIQVHGGPSAIAAVPGKPGDDQRQRLNLRQTSSARFQGRECSIRRHATMKETQQGKAKGTEMMVPK